MRRRLGIGNIITLLWHNVVGWYGRVIRINTSDVRSELEVLSLEAGYRECREGELRSLWLKGRWNGRSMWQRLLNDNRLAVQCLHWVLEWSNLIWAHLYFLEQAVHVATQYASAPLLPPPSLAAEQTQRSSTFPRQIRSHADRCSRALCVKAALSKAAWWPLTLKVVSQSHVTWDTSVPILVFLGLSVLNIGPMYATDRFLYRRRIFWLIFKNNNNRLRTLLMTVGTGCCQKWLNISTDT